MTEEPLGGNLNAAVRVGDTVRRTTGPWTPAIHALLRFLEERGFPAPRERGIDEQGREILAYIEGEAHSGTFEPLPDRVMEEANVIDAAKLLRRYHDVVADFRPPVDAIWRLVAPTKHEIICHNDWSPWNALFRDGRFALTLDWDLAGPGTPVWDVANAAYSWAPLSVEHRRRSLEEKARRVKLFLDAYGLQDRRAVLPTMRSRLHHVGRFIEAEARRGDAGMQRLVAWSVPSKMFEDDVRYLDEHWSLLERSI
ncbi:MAG: phosphotransferase [Candidatus Limnocylindria bacterium]|nr:phosphotransferase [Candidatus Limnocylindria bacterium]